MVCCITRGSRTTTYLFSYTTSMATSPQPVLDASTVRSRLSRRTDEDVCQKMLTGECERLAGLCSSCVVLIRNLGMRRRWMESGWIAISPHRDAFQHDSPCDPKSSHIWQMHPKNPYLPTLPAFQGPHRQWLVHTLYWQLCRLVAGAIVGQAGKDPIVSTHDLWTTPYWVVRSRI